MASAAWNPPDYEENPEIHEDLSSALFGICRQISREKEFSFVRVVGDLIVGIPWFAGFRTGIIKRMHVSSNARCEALQGDMFIFWHVEDKGRKIKYGRREGKPTKKQEENSGEEKERNR